MTRNPHQQVIGIRSDTYAVLRRIREDRSHPTFDMVIREALRKAFPAEACDL